ncbi:MAG: serine/threonine-protein kinase [Verrucomicrobiota bacterium]|nr:serine/threonine-protein kinase [Verrucomicrobiota bacterium]
MTFVPRWIDQYRIFAPIGAGGMAAVYRAEDTESGEEVAVKILNPVEHPSEADQTEFVHEAAVGELFDHPHLVKVYTHGVDSGTPYMVMELVEGQRLDQRMEAVGKMSEAMALEIAYQSALGLQEMHRQGMVHADIKPKNILISDDGVVKVFDFGLARSISRNGAPDGDMPEEIVGTPWYLPPERIEHQPEDERSDQYSLGATMFHMLAGRPPIEEGTAGEVALKQARQPLLTIKAYVKGISQPTGDLVTRMLKKEPGKRFASDAELIAALKAAREHVGQSVDLSRSQRRAPSKKRRGWMRGWRK